MYESITYAELKSLPKDQKPNAWKELKTLYSTQKELAEKLGVSPAIVYNMVARYAKEESAGVEKENKLEIAESPRKIRRKAKKQRVKENIVHNTAVIETKPVAAESFSTNNEAFSIMIKKSIPGEEAQFLLNGIGSTLVRNQNYSVEVRITEK